MEKIRPSPHFSPHFWFSVFVGALAGGRGLAGSDGAREAYGGATVGGSIPFLGLSRAIGTYPDCDPVGTCTQERLGGTRSESTAQENRTDADEVVIDLSEDVAIRATF